MDEKHGVIVLGLTQNIFTKIFVISVDCEWKSSDRPQLKTFSSANKLRDTCWFAIEPEDSRGYIVESIDAGIWRWWGLERGRLIETITFEVEPGKVNYVGHVAAAYDEVPDDFLSLEPMMGVGRKTLGFRVTDDFSSFEPTIRAGFGISEIVNKATDY
jgi:hypothetical protein